MGMKPAHLGGHNPALDTLRQQLLDAGLGRGSGRVDPQTPPNTPTGSPLASPPSSRRGSLDASAALAPRFDADRAQRRPTTPTAVSGPSSAFSLQLAAVSGSTIPLAPPPPPPSASASVLTSAPPRAATPAEIMARPANAGRTAAEKMELFVQPSFRPVVQALAADATYAAMFTELAARPPANLGSVLHQACANEHLLARAPQLAAKIAEGRAQDSNVPAEMAAGRIAGYQVHPHTYAGPGLDRASIERSLVGQFTRDAAMVKDGFVAARDSGELATFYASFTDKGSASCHAVRMNGIMEAFGTITERRAAAAAGPNLFDGSRAFDSAPVLQAAYALGDDEASIRAALATRNVPADGIAAIIQGLRGASLL
jgi:hypothetical protein